MSALPEMYNQEFRASRLELALLRGLCSARSAIGAVCANFVVRG